MKTLNQIREASGGKEAYMKFFNSLLKKFGVDSPSELKGDGKNKFFNALDKGWDGDGEKAEATIHLSNELFNEAIKAGKGNIKNVDVDLDATEYPGGEKKYIKDVKKRFKVTIKMVRYGAELSGKKADIIQFLLSDMYGGVGEDDIEDMWPELLEAFTFFKKKKKAAKVNVKPGRGNAKIDIDKDSLDGVKKGADKKHGISMRPRGDEIILSGPKDKLLSFVTQELGWDKNDVEDMWPDLLESQPDDQSDEDVPDDRGNYHGVEEGSTFANKLRGPAKEVFQKALAQIKKEKIKRSDEKKRNDIIDGIDGARHINDRDMRDIKRAMTYESHDDFKDDSDVDDYEGNYSGVNEEAPPGMEDVVKKLKADGNSDEEAFKIAWSIYNNKERHKRDYYDEGKNYPAMNVSQRKKIEKIAKANSGNMAKAIKLIDKLKKGMSDNPDVMDILKKANEATIHISNEINEKLKAGKGKDSIGTDVDWDNVGDEKKWIKQAKSKYKVTIKKDVGKYHSGAEISGKKADIIKFLMGPMYGGVDDRDIEDMWPSLVEGVSVDRRTLGFKDAMIRNEKAKKVREKAKLKKEKKKEQAVLDARYEYDGEVDTVLASANKRLFGQTEDAAANATAGGGVDMAPNASKKKKDKFKVVKHANY